jgi:Tfp pilus assembly PilM family ATPase
MKFRKFFDIFPPPKFLNIPYAGLSISDTAVRCIQFDTNRSGLYVKKYAERALPPGAVISGFINSPDEVVKVIESLKKDLNLSYVKVSLPEEKAYLFTTKIPHVSPKEVRSTIEFTIEDNVPLPASELSFNFGVADTLGTGDHVNVIVSAVPKKIIDIYVDTIQKAGLPLLSLEIESQAMARSLISRHDTGTRLVVHFGAEKVGLYIAYKRIVHFTSTIITTQPHDDLSLLSQEIKKLYVYWHTLKENVSDKNKHISQIIVCGERVTDAIVSTLSSQNDTPAVMGNVWTNAFDITSFIPPISFTDSLRYAASAGLALPNDILI